MNTSIVSGSLAAIASQQNASIAETFLSADAVILVDVSSSMETVDEVASWEGHGLTRYERACRELRRLQETLPGKVAVVAFSSEPIFCPGGQPTFLHGGTYLDKALRFVRVADDCDMRFILVSDGEPFEPTACLREARKFVSRIDTVFVGPIGGEGEEFLRQLAAASGGTSDTKVGAADLSNSIQRLLTTGAT
jgi:hypothetical protein